MNSLKIYPLKIFSRKHLIVNINYISAIIPFHLTIDSALHESLFVNFRGILAFKFNYSTSPPSYQHISLEKMSE